MFVAPPVVSVSVVNRPEKVGFNKSALDSIASAIALNSLSISVPFTILPALPLGKESFVAKLVDFK
jgi:hypothetical protein